jgi:hypothetical protein
MKHLLTLILFSLIFICWAADVIAEDGRRGTYIRMEETEIIGVVEHPDITYIIPKTRIRFSQIPLERDFADKTTHFTNPLNLETEVKVRTLLSGP